LPLAEAEPLSGSEAARRTDDDGAEDLDDRETVLVVEDDDTVRRGVTNTLKRAGYQVLSAHDAEGALRLVGEFDGLVDLTITDIHMPGMNGAQLVAALHQRDPDIRYLHISGDAREALAKSGLLGKDAAFLRKPFEQDELLRQVEALLKPRVGSR
jgi:two-component system cell cycle sensor histidine kinase/response regulator CckA